MVSPSTTISPTPPMPNSQRTILVTGASRGIGAEVAVRLAGADRHVVVNYRDKARRADEIVERIRDAGGTAVSVRADLCDESAVTAMLSTIGRLDVLVLNASGGMERGADPGYAMRINRDAQAALARRALEALSLIHISEPTRLIIRSRMPSSA